MSEPGQSEFSNGGWEQVAGEVLTRVGALDDKAVRDALAELWSLRAEETPPWELELVAWEQLGEASAGAEESAVDLVRRVIALGRTLIEVAQSRRLLDPGRDGNGPGDPAARLRLTIEEAAARAAIGRERAMATRREEWLSFLSHQLKNPLNTITTTVWLLRHGRDAPIADRLGPIERAVDRLLELIKDVRELNERVKHGVPDAFARRFVPPPE